jgi:O-antigen/teichoic acid export membrane protein
MHELLNRKIVQMGVIRGGAVFVALWLQIWLVAQFGASAYGEYVFFVTLSSLAIIVSKGGLDTLALKAVAIAHSHADARAVHVIRVWYLWRGLGLTAATCLALWLVYTGVANWYALPPNLNWWLICMSSVGAVLFQILVALTRGVNRPATADVFDAVIRTAILAAVAMALVVAHYTNATAIVISYALSYHFSAFVLFRLTSVGSQLSQGGATKAEEPRYGVRAHFGFMFAGLLGFVFFQMDTLVLGVYIDSVELGAYNMSCNLVRVVIFIPMILIVLVQPRIAVAFEKDDMRQVTRIAAGAIAASLVSALLCSLFLWLFGEILLRWIDPVFVVATPAMMILAVAHVVNSVLIIIGGIVSMTSKYFDVVKAQLAGSIVALAFYALLIPTRGQIGAALAMFTGLLVVLGCYAFMYRRYVTKSYDLLLSKAQ